MVNFNDELFVLRTITGDPYPFGCPSNPCQDNIAKPMSEKDSFRTRLFGRRVGWAQFNAIGLGPASADGVTLRRAKPDLR